MYSRKLNIFDYYEESNTIPIENNMTRNLAIVLKNNSVALNSVLSLIHKENIVIEKEPQFIIHRTVSRIKEEINLEDKQVIGVTLTASESLEIHENENTNETENPEPDLIILNDNTVYVFEVKRFGDNATEQLKNQIAKLTDIKREQIERKVPLIHLPWLDIHRELEEINKQDSSDKILRDYLLHIANVRPDLMPIQRFKQIDHSSGRIENIKRLKIAAQNYKLIHNQDDKEVKQDSADRIWFHYPKTETYLQRIGLRYEKNKPLVIEGHLANTKGQGNQFYYAKNEDDFESALKNNTICIEGNTFPIVYTPYIKIATPTPSSVYLGKIDFKDADKITYKKLENFHDSYSGKHKIDNNIDSYFNEIFKENDNIEKLDLISPSDIIINNKSNSFYLSVSIKFEIKEIGEYLEKLDEEDNNPKSRNKEDVIALFVDDVFKAIHETFKKQ